MYNKLKQIAKTTHYAHKLNTLKNDYKKSWTYDWEKQRYIWHSFTLQNNNDIITNPNQISYALCNYCTNVQNTQSRCIGLKCNFQHIFKIALNKFKIVFYESN